MFRCRTRTGAADVPVRIRRRVVQIRVQSAYMRVIVRVAAVDRRRPKHRSWRTSNPCVAYYVIYVISGGGIPLLRFAQFTLSDKWFARRGAADDPARIRRRVVQKRVQSAHTRAIVRVAAADRVCRDAVIKPKAIAIICRAGAACYRWIHSIGKELVFADISAACS